MKAKDLIDLIKDSPEADITVDGCHLEAGITETKEKGTAATVKKHVLNLQTVVKYSDVYDR